MKSVLGGYFRDPLHRDLLEWIEREGGDVFMHEGKKHVWSVKGVQVVGFPNPAFPSDHMPVVSEFMWKS